MTGRSRGTQRRAVDARLLAGAIAAVVVLVLAGFALAAQSIFNPSVHTLALELPSAAGLVSGSDVLEAGAKVGSVASITPTTHDSALIDVSIGGDHWPLHRGLSADIRPKSLLGEEYVDLHDGPSGAPAYNAAVVYHGTASSDPVQLDQFLNSLDPATRAATQQLINDLGAGVAGQGGNLNAAIAASRADLANLATTGQTLAGRDASLDQIIVALDGVLQKITTNDQLAQLSQLITNGQATLAAIDAERATFSRSFSDADVALAELNTAVDAAVPSLRTTVGTAPHLLTSLGQESVLLAYLGAQVNLPGVLPNLVAGIQRGPESTGGAVEHEPGGGTNSIFRVCILVPTVSSACSGHGAAQPAASSGGGAAQLVSALSGMFGS